MAGQGPEQPITPRAVAVAILGTLFMLAWVRQSEMLVPTSHLTESNPPIPAIIILAAVWTVTTVLRWTAEKLSPTGVPRGLQKAGATLARLALTRQELMVVYLFLLISCAIPALGMARMVLPCMMELQYFYEPQNHFAEMAQEIPPTWAPGDPEIVRQFWEGSERSVPPSRLQKLPVLGTFAEGVYQFFATTLLVPWDHWAVPFTVWCIYLIIYFITMFCIASLFRRKWAQDDHLTFPLASISIEMLRSGSSPGAGRPFFRDPVAWIGFMIVAIYNVMNMLNVFYPNVPALGIQYQIGAIFTEAPWSAMQGLRIFYKPEVLGMAYLVPSDILLSIFVFSLALWVARPVAQMYGFNVAGFPMSQVQATGASIMLALYFIYSARLRLWETLRKALGLAPRVWDDEEPVSYRWAWIGAAGGTLLLVGWPVAHGVDWWAMCVYLAVGHLFLITYLRNRAETGLPIVWGYPLLQQRAVLTNFLGTKPLIMPGRLRSFTLLSMLSFYMRGTYYAVTSTGQESCLIGATFGMSQRKTSRLLLMAMIIGYVLSMWLVISTYYAYGGNTLETTTGTAGSEGARWARWQFDSASRWIDYPEGPNRANIAATLVGAGVTLSLALARRIWLNFPLHPVGYAFACFHETYIWFPAMVVLIIRTAVLRIGGVRTYRRLVPGFLAFTLGHFVCIGIWSLVGLYAGDDVMRYTVWFL